MPAGAVLFADNVDDAVRSPAFWVAVGLLAGLLLAGAAVLHFVDKWRKRDGDRGREPIESLASFRELYEAGEMSEAEYQRVRAKLAARLKNKPAVGGGGGGETPAGGAADPPPAGGSES